MLMINPKTAEKLDSDLTDKEAAETCLKQTEDGFALDLGTKYFQSLRTESKGLSDAQFWWLHKKAIMILTGSDVKKKIDLGDFTRLSAIFTSAAKHLKYPKITFNEEGSVIQLAMTSRGKEPGSIVVTNGGKYGSSSYYGRISKDGSFTATSRCDDFVTDFLQKFAENPAEVAASYGKKSGVCCFCNRALTDRSAEIGYGDTCAQHYGLPWFDCRSELFKEAKKEGLLKELMKG